MKRMHLSNSKNILYVILLATLLTGCFQQTQYHTYLSIGPEGWGRNRYVTFTTDSIRKTLPCNIYIELRNDSKYKYQDLWLVIANDIDSTNYYQYDTVHYYLTDNDGHFNGKGIGNLHEYCFKYKQTNLHAGSRPVIRIKHIMRDGKLYGISDIGIKIEHCDQHQSSRK